MTARLLDGATVTSGGRDFTAHDEPPDEDGHGARWFTCDRCDTTIAPSDDALADHDCSRTPAPLIPEARWRKARKSWTCECPGRGLHGRCPHLMCSHTIKPGTDYVEYLGEATAYESGTRYCPTCGFATWGVSA